jgi:hypothetical protein
VSGEVDDALVEGAVLEVASDEDTPTELVGGGEGAVGVVQAPSSETAPRATAAA